MTLFRLCIRVTLMLLLVPLDVAVAAEDGQRQTQAAVTMSQAVYDGLQAAQALIESKRFDEGHKQLTRLRESGSLSSYESAQIWNLSAYAYYLAEDHANAIAAYQRVLEHVDLPAALVQSTLKTASQLYFTVEDYARALDTVDRLIAILPEAGADIHLLKGQAHYQLEQYREAIEPIRVAIRKRTERGATPLENALLVLRACYYELGEFKHLLAVLKELIVYYPKKTYVLTLAGVYSELGETRKQLALTEALYEAGQIDAPRQLLNLANLYLVHGLPFKAAKLLEIELEQSRIDQTSDNLRLLSQAWYQARDDAKAIAPLLRAAQMSEDGELHVRLAQSYINLERWSDAAAALTTGIAKSGLERADTAHLMLGMALFNQRKLSAARKAFEVAVRDTRSAAAARQWLAYLDSEITRDSTLDQTLPERAARRQNVLLDNL